MERSHRMLSVRPLAAALSIALASCFGLADVSARVEPAMGAAAPPAVRGSIPVTNCNDSGPGSLRDVYFNAIDEDVIDLSNVGCSTITLTTGALTNSPSADNVTLLGPGKYDLTIDGGNANRVLVHNGDGALNLVGLTVANGSYTGPYGGGCIYSYGQVSIQYANITSCSLGSTGTDHAYGGAVYARGEVLAIYANITASSATAPQGNSGGGAVWANAAKLYASTVSGNTVSGDGSHYARGGGIVAATDLVIGYSLVANNTADSGGGVFMIGASDNLAVVDSTISGNHARGAAGGVYAKYRPVTIANSTISQNTAVFDFGAGLYTGAGADLESSIIAGNTSNDGLRTSDVAGPIGTPITGANNLVIDSTLPLPPDTIVADPMLGPLQDNGGRTWTHALLPGSPAIDHGNNLRGLDIDQRVTDDSRPPRGYERTVGPATDIGAFEFGAPDAIFVDGFEGETAQSDGA